jgi:hypothetical protein
MGADRYLVEYPHLVPRVIKARSLYEDHRDVTKR